jgi:hypothetical protein
MKGDGFQNLAKAIFEAGRSSLSQIIDWYKRYHSTSHNGKNRKVFSRIQRIIRSYLFRSVETLLELMKNLNYN